MKRRLLYLLLLVAVLLSLCGCGGRSPAPSPSPRPVTSKGTPIVASEDYDDIRMISTPDSTCFSSIGYKSGRLVVTFRDSGASYAYLDVPESVWSELRDADSMGGYYNSEIKGYYDCEKLD